MKWFIDIFWKLYGKVFGIERESEYFFETIIGPLLQYGHANGISAERLSELWGEAFSESDSHIVSPVPLFRDKIMDEIELNHRRKYENSHTLTRKR